MIWCHIGASISRDLKMYVMLCFIGIWYIILVLIDTYVPTYMTYLSEVVHIQSTDSWLGLNNNNKQFCIFKAHVYYLILELTSGLKSISIDREGLVLCSGEFFTNFKFQNGKHPQIVHMSDMTRLWYKQDETFLLPKALVKLEFFSPLAYLDPLNTSLSFMYTSLIKDDLNEFSYDASLARLDWSFGATRHGFEVISFLNSRCISSNLTSQLGLYFCRIQTRWLIFTL